MKKYDNYKDSGIDWIGNIPSGWSCTKLKFHTKKIIDGAHFTPTYIEKSNDSIPFLRVTDLHSKEILLDEVKYIPLSEHQELIKRCNPEIGDLLLSKNGTIGLMKIIDWDWEFSVFVSLCLLKFENSLLNKFFYYFFESNIVDRQLFESSQKTSVSNLHLEKIKELRLTLPSIEEQNIISKYLDHKTAQIDTLISKKQQFITLLQEERIAVINQAVTKGLDPKVKMKDSGIEWLGEIPEHWTSYRIDWVTNIVRGNTGFKKDELLKNGEYVALQYGKTYKVDIVDDSFNFFVNSEFFKESQVVSKGDTILISTSETVEDLGHTCFYNNGNIGLLGGEQILLKPNRKVLYEKYLYQYARQFRFELKKYAKGLKVFRFNTTDLKQIFIAIPSIEEQIQIADFLDLETIRIDSLISKSKQEIELLKEYKTALISEVVTGKADVRDVILN
ncbi:restriction endonuclease subunit S [Flavobacterium sp. HJJ]|uniref:restriction endonuclease subunit S n=1 Tax=Flavobacterium sp. HJJ TaxID=2783792 RepID=UPI00188D13A5|nr:restriction endonuclease subunit S [Flavobacterium sp. HJJ]MBF4472609.1 restriction endonuclease subunit S [Flavobacterium sp. HJJ]